MKYECEFDFSDLDDVMELVHMDCPPNEKGICLHFDEAKIQALVNSVEIHQQTLLYVQMAMELQLAGASSETKVEHIHHVLAYAFYCGALYARHKVSSMKLEEMMKGKGEVKTK